MKERLDRKLANAVPEAAGFKSLILLFFFSARVAATGRSLPGRQFLPEAFTGG